MAVSNFSNALLRGIKTTFLREIPQAAAGSWVGVFAERVTSEHPNEIYSWLGEAPRMELLKDEIIMQGLTDVSYQVNNNIYHAALRVKRTEISDDQTGTVLRRARGLARVAMLFPNRLLIDALTTNSTGYDGSAFFSDTHADRGGGVQDNLLAGTGTTTAQFSTDLNTAIGTMAGFVGENGDPLNEMANSYVVLAHPAMRKPIIEALNAQIIGQTSNVAFAGLDIRPIFTARLTDQNDWYLFNTSGFPTMPLIYQEREPLTTEELGEGSDWYVVHEEMVFKARWRGAVGYGHWATAIKVVNS